MVTGLAHKIFEKAKNNEKKCINKKQASLPNTAFLSNRRNDNDNADKNDAVNNDNKKHLTNRV